MNIERYFLTKHTTKNPSFFDIDELSNDFITNHNKKYYFFLIECYFKLLFINDFSKPICIETEFYHNTKFMNLKRYLLYPIESFIEEGHI